MSGRLPEAQIRRVRSNEKGWIPLRFEFLARVAQREEGGGGVLLHGAVGARESSLRQTRAAHAGAAGSLRGRATKHIVFL